jgi:hypothetical protein
MGDGHVNLTQYCLRGPLQILSCTLQDGLKEENARLLKEIQQAEEDALQELLEQNNELRLVSGISSSPLREGPTLGGRICTWVLRFNVWCFVRLCSRGGGALSTDCKGIALGARPQTRSSSVPLYTDLGGGIPYLLSNIPCAHGWHVDVCKFI